MDFIRGAALAPEGRADHRAAVDRRGRDGLADRRARCSEGAGVVTTRAHVRTVVTEWGVAELFGKSLRERAKALIAIAHPDFRDELRGRRPDPPPGLIQCPGHERAAADPTGPVSRCRGSGAWPCTRRPGRAARG